MKAVVGTKPVTYFTWLDWTWFLSTVSSPKRINVRERKRERVRLSSSISLSLSLSLSLFLLLHTMLYNGCHFLSLCLLLRYYTARFCLSFCTHTNAASLFLLSHSLSMFISTSQLLFIFLSLSLSNILYLNLFVTFLHLFLCQSSA